MTLLLYGIDAQLTQSATIRNTAQPPDMEKEAELAQLIENIGGGGWTRTIQGY